MAAIIGRASVLREFLSAQRESPNFEEIMKGQVEHLKTMIEETPLPL